MAFNFGGTAPSAFGNKTTGFGTLFGSAATSTNQPTSSALTTSAGTGFGFGTNTGTTFGMVQPTQSTFGATPAFGTGTTFGSQPTATTTAGGLFGSNVSKPPLFGTTNTAPTGGSLFSSGTSNLFGQTGTTPSIFGSTSATTTTPSLFGGLGNTTTTTGTTGLFGATPNLFGTTTTPSTFTGFGTSATSLPFGTTNLFGSTGGFGTAKPATAQNTTEQQNQAVLASIYTINIFNDERDEILKKWNLLQACWGSGKGYYNANQPPVEYTVHNPFYRFKAIAYNIIPKYENADGIVKLIFNRKYTELNDQKTMLSNGLNGILGNRPNLKLSIQHIKAINEDQSEIRICVDFKSTNRKVPASDLSAYLNQPAQRQQLTNVGVSYVCALVTPSKSVLDEYLVTVPPGFEKQFWQVGINDNPDPNRFMPVPVYGFNDLKTRKTKQEYDIGMHTVFCEKIDKELAELQKKYVDSLARINEFKLRFIQLQYRTLEILVKQESIRRTGTALQPEEEALKTKFESLYATLKNGSHFKGRLNELISTVRLLEYGMKPGQPRYQLVDESQEELKAFLQLQQNGIAKLLEVVKEDMQALNIIDQGLNNASQTTTNT